MKRRNPVLVWSDRSVYSIISWLTFILFWSRDKRISVLSACVALSSAAVVRHSVCRSFCFKFRVLFVFFCFMRIETWVVLPLDCVAKAPWILSSARPLTFPSPICYFRTIFFAISAPCCRRSDAGGDCAHAESFLVCWSNDAQTLCCDIFRGMV